MRVNYKISLWSHVTCFTSTKCQGLNDTEAPNCTASDFLLKVQKRFDVASCQGKVKQFDSNFDWRNSSHRKFISFLGPRNSWKSIQTQSRDWFWTISCSLNVHQLFHHFSSESRTVKMTFWFFGLAR